MSTYSPAQSLPDIDLIPKGRIGRFIVEREIGQGSVGTVYEFRDPLIGRKVAIKILKPLLQSDQRQVFEKHFIQEARAAGRLNHPNIVTVYDADKSDDVLFIAMEYLEGRELRDILAGGHQFTYKQIADMVARIANALDYAHKNGVIHRDIKPANIFIVGKYTPKVLDFGIASASRQITDQEASLGFATLSDRRLIGTPSYMSPEQTRAEIVDGRSDIFSLGVVLYQLLCGELPFKGETIPELLESIEYDSPIPPHDIRTDVPSRLAYIAGKALAKKPGDRYATAGEMANDLNRFIAKERTNQIIATLRNPIDENGAAAASPIKEKLANKLPLLMGVAGLVLVVTAGIAAWASHKVVPQKAALDPVAQVDSRTAITKESTENKLTASPQAVEKKSESAVTAPVPPTSKKNSSDKKVDAHSKLAAKADKKSKQVAVAATPAAAATGTLLIAVTPWGEVFVDGKSKGVAPPLSHLTLPVGTHTVEIRNGEEQYAAKINVTPDNEVKVGHRF